MVYHPEVYASLAKSQQEELRRSAQSNPKQAEKGSSQASKGKTRRIAGSIASAAAVLFTNV